MKRVLGMILALMMIVSIPAAAFADDYDLANGYIVVNADEDGQNVSQYQQQYSEEGFITDTTIVIDHTPDPAPTITGSSDNNSVSIISSEGSEANVTLQNVDGVALYVYGDGDATINLEGSNTFDGNPYNPVVIDNGTTTIEGSGSLIGIATDAEEQEWMAEYPDEISTAGVLVVAGSTLNVESGNVTGINQNQDLPGINPGIGFMEDAKLTVGEDVKVYDAAGNDVTEAAVANPSVLNTSAVASIKAQPTIINHMVAGTALQKLETAVKDANGNEIEGKVIVEIYENHFVKITVRTAGGFYTELCGRVTLKDGELVFLFSRVEYKLTADNVLILPLRNGGTVEVKLTDEVLEIIRGLF